MWQLTLKLGRYKGASWPLGETPLIIGRSTQCDVVVREPEVSREHCRISLQDHTIVCEDLGSSNATLVNGQPIDRIVLHMGDEVAVGTASFIVTRATPGDMDRRTPITEGTTIAVLLHPRELRVSAASQGLLHARPRHVKDLAMLHDFALLAGECAAQEALAQVVVECVARNTAVSACAMLLSDHGGTRVHTYPQESDVSDTLMKLMLEGKDAESPTLLHFDDEDEAAGRDACLIPIRSHDQSIGVLWMEFGMDAGSDKDADISFALSIIRLAAPFLAELGHTRRSAPHNVPAVIHAIAESILVGVSPEIEHVRRVVALAARAELPVLIQGETGTGKELVARLLHQTSSRLAGPFIAINCATVPDSLFESEFFGHTKGAFTGATHSRRGLMEQADNGVLFLDEFASLSLHGQARLLRALEYGVFRPVGSEKEVVVNIWVIAASNRNLLQAVVSGNYRDDLYYRLSAIEIHIPPLRDRKEDVISLVDHFSREYANEKNVPAPILTDPVKARLAQEPWPGNVRELRNCIRRIAALFPDGAITLAELETILPRAAATTDEMPRSARDVERMHIKNVLEETDGRISEAASILGLHRNTLREKIKQYGL